MEDFIEGPFVTETIGNGWCVRIHGSDIFESSSKWGTKPLHTLSIAKGLKSKEEAEEVMRKWLLDQLSKVGLGT